MPLDSPAYYVSGFLGGGLLLRAAHFSEASKDADVEAWRCRMARGEADRIAITDCSDRAPKVLEVIYAAR